MQSQTQVTPSQLNRSYFDNISFFAKHFCIPKQIQLVDWQLNAKEGRQFRDNIQIVDRADIYDMHPFVRDIADAPIDTEAVDPGDGLISVVRYLNIKVAICVTVYSQDKSMLKNTLQGIRKNYQKFYQKAGILSHQILVIVIYDGIEKLSTQKQSDKNMCSLFRQIDLINGFRKKQYILAKQKEYEGIQQQSESQIIDIENFADQMIFTEKQYQQLQQTLFDNQYSQYNDMLKLLQFAQDLQKKKLSGIPISELPGKMKKALVERTRMYLEENGIVDITQDDLQLERYIQQNLSQEKVEILKLQGLRDCIQLAQSYLKVRQTTAILYQSGLPLEQQDTSEENAKMYIFCVLKHANKGKLSSHLWFFQGFCNMINPDACILIDCGTVPHQDAIFKMWAHIDTFKETCGGVCGYMKARTQNPFDQAGNRPDGQSQSGITRFFSYFVDIQKAQVFEYHFSHLLDKPYEGLTGYIHVLPGAFSGYNWDSLKNQKLKFIRSDGKVYEKQNQKKAKRQILKKYLKTVVYNEPLQDIKQANMFLAEDRVLCLQIYTKKQRAFNLEYLPNAQCHVDPVTTLPKLLAQRKRWINGSWFALEYVLDNQERVKESSHNCWDKLFFYLNMMNASLTRSVSYVGVSLFFVTFHMMVNEFSATILLNYFKQAYNLSEEQLIYAKIFKDFLSIRSVIANFTPVVDFLFLIGIFRLIFISITMRRQTVQSKKSINRISTWLGIFGILFLILIILNVIDALIGDGQSSNIIQMSGTFTQRTFIYLLGAIAVSYLIVILSAFSFSTYYDFLTSLLSYLFYTPTYINIFMIFAFCRIDDFSWGTKGLDNEVKAKQNTIKQKFTDQKLKFTQTWLITNILVALILTTLSNDFTIQNYIIWIFSAYFAIAMIFKVFFVIVYLLKYYLYKSCVVRSHLKQIKKANTNDSIIQRDNFKEFVRRVKQKEMDEHLDQINQEIIEKNMFSKAIHQRKKEIVGFASRFAKLNTIIEQSNQNSPNSPNRKTPLHSKKLESLKQISQSSSSPRIQRRDSFKENSQFPMERVISPKSPNSKSQDRPSISFKQLQRISMQIQKFQLPENQ